MRVFLCEKPDQARNIAMAMGNPIKQDGAYRVGDDVLTWAFGHLYEQAEPEDYDPALKRWSLQPLPFVPETWRLKAKPKTQAQLRVIRSLLKSASHVVLATDADREGELLGREILIECGYRGPLSRLWLQALNKPEVLAALRNLLPGSAKQGLYNAGLCRSRADWLVGMNLTRLYTLLGQAMGQRGVLPVGRVQTPTLRMVVERDQEIETFVPKAYWTLVATCFAGDTLFPANWVPPQAVADDEGRCISESAARSLAQQLSGASLRVISATTKRESQPPPLPYYLPTLQADAERRYGIPTEETQEAAQQLYERYKVTTYPRTTCEYLPTSMIIDVPAVLQALKRSDVNFLGELSSANPAIRTRAWNDDAVAKESHHGIIPTTVEVDVTSLPLVVRQVYDLIRRRYVAQFYPDYMFDSTKVEFNGAGHRFVSSGRVSVRNGWTAVVATETPKGADGNDIPRLPQLKPDQITPVRTVAVNPRQTKPPRRFTKSSLQTAMETVASRVADPRMKAVLKENAGIGTVGTRTAIVKGLIDRELLQLTGKRQELVSTPRARQLIHALPQAVSDPVTTAMWEQTLGDVAAGKITLERFMGYQEAWVRSIVEKAREAAPPAASASRAVDVVTSQISDCKEKQCPSCGKPMRLITGSRGSFWGCSGYPKCKKTIAS